MVAGTGCAAVAKEVAAVNGVTKVKLDLNQVKNVLDKKQTTWKI